MSELPPQAKDRLTTSLLGIGSSEYGPAYRDHSLEIYKVYLEMVDRISGRREKANSFFLAINAALITILAKDVFGIRPDASNPLGLLVPVSAVVLCYLWYRIIRSYRDLNSAKFKVIHAIERQLPLRPYDAEWESVDRGKNKKLYLPFTHIEIMVPWLFMILHIIFAIAAIGWAGIWNTFRGAG